eukprot:gene5499-11072_t
MLEQSYVKFGTLTTHTYEVTFNAGTLGINLLATRAGYGGYVDTFYRPPDGSILFAEQSGLIKRGDLILEINGEDVSRISLNELPKRIEKAKRPIVIKFENVSMDITFADVVSDPRKMPWFMQYLMETYGVEEAVTEQAKLMLWLECESYQEHIKSIPDGDYSDQETLIFKKFFREESNFSLLYSIPDNLRHLIFAALSALGLESRSTNNNHHNNNNQSNIILGHFTTRKGVGSQLLIDAQHWVEEDMSKGSFKQYLFSEAAARMVGYLRYSPPFVKITLMDVLRCDRKSMYFVVFLCQIKRHAAIHCNNILRVRGDDYPEGTVGHAEDILRKAVGCVHVLGLQEGRAGIEDLPMLTTLKKLLPELVELPGILNSPAPCDGFPAQSGLTNVVLPDPYIDMLNANISLSVPLSNELKSMARDSSKKVLEIRVRLQELRLAMLRELSSELMPKFLASKEFEVLLWEIEAHRQFTVAERANATRELSEGDFSSYNMDSEGDSEGRSDESNTKLGDEDSASLGSLGTIGEEDSKDVVIGVVPDGAVQRLLRKVSLPSTMTMHRAPLSLLDEARDELRRRDIDAAAWLVTLDTHGTAVKNNNRDHRINRERDRNTPRASNITTRGDVFTTTDLPVVQVTQELKIDYILPIGLDRHASPYLDTTIVPSTLSSFLVPSGKFVWDSTDRSPVPAPRLFNLVVSTRDNMPLYVAALLMYRPMTDCDMEIPPETPSQKRYKDTPSDFTTPSKDPSLSSISKNNNNTIQTPSLRSGKSTNHGESSSSNTIRSNSPSLNATMNGISSFDNNNSSSSNAIRVTPHRNNNNNNNNNTNTTEYNGAKRNMLLGLGDKDNPPRPLLGRMNGALSPIVMRGKALVGGVLRSRSVEFTGELLATSATSTTTSDSNTSDGQTSSLTDMDDDKSRTDGNSSVSWSEQSNNDERPTASAAVDISSPSSSPLTYQHSKTNDPSNITTTNSEANNNSTNNNDNSSSNNGTSSDVLLTSDGTTTSTTTQTGDGAFATPMKKPVTPVQAGFEQLPFTSPLDYIRKNYSGSSKENLQVIDNDDNNSTSSIGTSNLKTTPRGKENKERERMVPYSLCLVTKTPCIDALRLPLAWLARRPEIRFPESTSTNTSTGDINSSTTTSGGGNANANAHLATQNTGSNDSYSEMSCSERSERRSLLALSLMEEEDSFKLLRQLASNSPRGGAVPTILRPDGAHDMDMEMIFRALNPRNIVTILIAFILEFKIAIVSSKLTSLTVLGEILKTLIAPLRWSHIYVPVLPKNMSTELLQCPTPFFVGLLRENFDTSAVPSDVCLLDLENDACRVPSSLAKALYAGRRLARSLDELMRPALFRCDDIDPLGGTLSVSASFSASVSVSGSVSGSTPQGDSLQSQSQPPSLSISPPTIPIPPIILMRSNSSGGGVASATSSSSANQRYGGAFVRDIIRLCKAFVADILEGIDECSIHCIDHSEVVVLFDEAMFSAHKAQRAKYSEFPGDKAFLEQLMRTQCFSMCVGGSILKRLDPHSRPPSRPSSPFLAMAPLQE